MQMGIVMKKFDILKYILLFFFKIRLEVFQRFIFLEYSCITGNNTNTQSGRQLNGMWCFSIKWLILKT